MRPGRAGRPKEPGTFVAVSVYPFPGPMSAARRFRSPLAACLLLALSGAGCSFFGRTPLPETPEAPVFDDVAATREGRAARGAADPARLLGSRLRAHGLQPLTQVDRRLALGRDTVAAGFVAGKDPLWDEGLVVVAVSQEAGGVALGAFSELVRVTARLARATRFPERTVLFATLPAGAGTSALRRLTQGPTWVADSVAAVVLIGGETGTGVTRVPETVSAGLTARAAYDVLKPLVYGLRAPGDTLSGRRGL